jgi:hypothetical protein
MTFIVRATRGEDAVTAVRLRADTAVAKACDLVVAGWHVVIECPNGIRNYPDDFDNLISVSRDDSALPSQYSEIDLDVAVWHSENLVQRSALRRLVRYGLLPALAFALAAARETGSTKGILLDRILQPKSVCESPNERRINLRRWSGIALHRLDRGRRRW